MVDIAGIRGKLLISPAPGSLAGPASSPGSGYVMAGGARSQPPLSRAWRQNGQEGPAALIRLDGGLGLERARASSRQRGPSPWPTGRPPVRRRCPGPFPFAEKRGKPRRARRGSGTNPRAGSLFAENQCSAGGNWRQVAGGGSIRGNRGQPVEASARISWPALSVTKHRLLTNTAIGRGRD